MQNGVPSALSQGKTQNYKGNDMNKKEKFSLSFILPLLAVCLSLSLLAGTPLKKNAFSSSAGDENSLYTGFAIPTQGGQEETVAVSLPKDFKEKKLYPGGVAFGVRFQTDGLIVIGFSDVVTDSGKCNPAYDAGLREKDIITDVNGRSVVSATELTEAVESFGGKEIKIGYKRNGKGHTAYVTPVYSSAEGRYKTGLLIRDSGAGIGTVTFIDPENMFFGGLGHGICDSDTGALVPMTRGSVLDVKVSGIAKGTPGAPGEIKGYFASGKTGTLMSNTRCGVYGYLSQLPKDLTSEPLPLGSREDIKEGDAYIYCTLDEGGVGKYGVSISAIDRSANGNKCFSIKVTDPALIEKTGGIIQGMSGSPVIQNGKLVGAVTHVLINDPTTGYGIFIENMLNAAQMPEARAS